MPRFVEGSNCMTTTLEETMYDLFTQRFDSNNSVIRPPAFELIRRIYQREIGRIVQYYNERVFTVPSNHLLCRLLTTASVPFSYELDRYTEAAYARSPYIGKHFNFTSDISYGKFFDGIFYGKGCTELVVSVEEYFNPYDAIQNWKSLTPVTVLEHPVSDLGLMLPDGDENSTAKGLAVIAVNIPMLLIQFRGFMIEQASRVGDIQASLLDTSHFVHMYVLPGMMKSHTEIVILNRLKNLFYGAPMSDAMGHHAFQVTDYSDKLDRVLNEIIAHVRDRSILYASMLKNIPTVFSRDMQEFLLMPDIAPTRQVWWALLLTRLSTMNLLFDMGGEEARRNNATLLNRLRIDMKRLDRESILTMSLPDDLYYETAERIENMLKD